MSITKRFLQLSLRRRILLSVALPAGVVLIWLWLLDRPGSLSLRFQSHAVTPSVKQLIINDRRMMARASVTGRNENGPASYAHRFTDRMDYRVLWYDFVEEQAWQAEFSVSGRDLCTFGDRRDHAVLKVTVGPGADVTVGTSNAEALR
ncbi:hypothetical protein, partial [Nitrincola lacisaponensis]|uniref:hypothetical protein n=1 Tax=Nitrincola lacisaponensis TaxID=267850 RepID=UPI00055FF6B0